MDEFYKEIRDDIRLLNQKMDRVLEKDNDRHERMSGELGGIKAQIVLIYTIVVSAVLAAIGYFFKH